MNPGFLVNVGMTYYDYRARREEGHGMLRSALTAYLNYRIWSNMPFMIGAQLAGLGVPPLIRRSAAMMRSVRRMTTPFAPAGNLPDTDEITRSKNALMQSAMATNGRLGLSGHSWAGSEAAIFHNRYGI